MKRVFFGTIKWGALLFIVGGLFFKLFIFEAAFDSFYYILPEQVQVLLGNQLAVGNAFLKMFFVMWGAISLVAGFILSLVYKKPVFKTIL